MKRFYSLVSIMLFVLTISFANINTVKAVENLEQENEITEEVIQKEDVEIQEKKEEIDLSLVNNRNEDEGKENEIQSTPGQVTGDKTAEVVTGDGEDGRSADVTIIVKGEEFDETSTEEREIVLVLDVSGSMNEEIESRKTKIDALIESANELINSLLSEENINTTTVGIVFYSTKAESFCNLTNDKGVLKECLKSVEDIEIALENDLTVDMLEIDIKRIWELLGNLIGESYDEELLDNLFSKFCLGK